jgi:predicted TIM-barrel fold metal-dependent hydrolase
MVGADEQTERALAQHLARTIEETTEIDATVVLAFDAVYDLEGRRDESRTHLHVTNEYVMELAQPWLGRPGRAQAAMAANARAGRLSHRILFGASVHPYRRDALDEVERCVRGGAVLMKWLPVSQGMDPSHRKCVPFYEALAHHKLPLLCHTGGELSLPRFDDSLADPMLLEEALRRGVTVIMAHCGTRSSPTNRDYLPQFMRLARQYANCYGDTSALNLPSRWYAYEQILSDRIVRENLVHGSDWPIIAIPPVGRIDVGTSLRLMRDSNWLRRDVRIKQQLGFDDAYWNRAATVLRLPKNWEGEAPAEPAFSVV